MKMKKFLNQLKTILKLDHYGSKNLISKRMKVVILAGGLGTRLSEYTHSIPKPMIKIKGRPTIYHKKTLFQIWF